MNKLKDILLCIILYSTMIGQVIITEIFSETAQESEIPDYIELYNSSEEDINLDNWSILVEVAGRDTDGVVYNQITSYSADQPAVEGKSIISYTNPNIYINNIKCGEEEMGECSSDSDDLVLESQKYFLISSYSNLSYQFYNNIPDVKLYFDLYSIGQDFSTVEVIMNSITLFNNNNEIIDKVEFNNDGGWPEGSDMIGHSIRLDSPYLDNAEASNWSISPETEKSNWLYEIESERFNFGSPKKENSFKLLDVEYSDSFYNESYGQAETHFIYGDVYDYYTSEPFKDENFDGIYNSDEEYYDWNKNNEWDSSNNNFEQELVFPWIGTFIKDTEDYNYKIIIEKNSIPILDVPSFYNISDTLLSIFPSELDIDPLGLNREIAEYTWTVELTKNYSDRTYTIYSDRQTLIIDSSDYGIYGCVDDGTCNSDGNCSTSGYFDSIMISNNPVGCIPGNSLDEGGCYSALNYYSNANINSNTCHYVSLSIPSFSINDDSSISSVPIYFNNDSSSVIDSINYVLSFSQESNIMNYNFGTFNGTIFPDLSDDLFPDQNSEEIAVIIALDNVDFNREGIISFLNFDLYEIGIESLYFQDNVIVVGGDPSHPQNILNTIPIYFQNGSVVNLDPLLEISGNVSYYKNITTNQNASVSNVSVQLIKSNGNNTSIDQMTDIDGNYYYNENITYGNYNLIFSKSSDQSVENSFCLNHSDLGYISRHINQSDIFNNFGDYIAADVNLDGKINSLDKSYLAQYIVGIKSNLNDLNINWLFKPAESETLAPVFADFIDSNGRSLIEYEPLIIDDLDRPINAYLLGDLSENLCYVSDYQQRQSLVENDFIDVEIKNQDLVPILLLVSEPVFISGITIELGFDKDIFQSESFNFDPEFYFSNHFESITNLNFEDGKIKIVIWTDSSPELINGTIGELIFNWNQTNLSGKIWLESYVINDSRVNGGISLSIPEVDFSSHALNLISKQNLLSEFSLDQNYPNPFNPQTNISWSMPYDSNVSIKIYNINGKLIDTIYDGYKDGGKHTLIWDASSYASGIYIYRLISDNFIKQNKMILLR